MDDEVNSSLPDPRQRHRYVINFGENVLNKNAVERWPKLIAISSKAKVKPGTTVSRAQS